MASRICFSLLCEKMGFGVIFLFFRHFWGTIHFGPRAIFYSSANFSHFWISACFPFYTRRPDSQHNSGEKQRRNNQAQGCTEQDRDTSREQYVEAIGHRLSPRVEGSRQNSIAPNDQQRDEDGHCTLDCHPNRNH